MKICVIPDCQVKGGDPIDHLTHVGKFIADKKPDVVVCIGDFADMPSLSSYDKGKKSFEGRRYKKDVEAVNLAMLTLMAPIKKEMKRLRRNKKKQWKPRFVMTLGNHENRINRAVENDAMLEDVISTDALGFNDWEVYPFLEVVEIEGVYFSHYFISGAMGRPVSSARALLTKKMVSCVQGHSQTMDVAYSYRPDGKRITALFSGACYQHDEDYLTPQGNYYWRAFRCYTKSMRVVLMTMQLV